MSDEAKEKEQEQTPAWFRDQLERKDDQLKKAQEQLNRQRMKLLEGAFGQAGLDPTKGLGKAIAERYEGEPDADEIRTFAVEKYGWEPPEEKAENPMAGAITEAQQRVGAAVGQSAPMPTQPIDLEIEEAEKRGDFATTMALKVQKYRQTQGI